MALGSKNRDYKTGNRAVTSRLMAFDIIAANLRASGVDDRTASAKAFDAVDGLTQKQLDALNGFRPIC